MGFIWIYDDLWDLIIVFLMFFVSFLRGYMDLYGFIGF